MIRRVFLSIVGFFAFAFVGCTTDENGALSFEGAADQLTEQPDWMGDLGIQFEREAQGGCLADHSAQSAPPEYPAAIGNDF